MHYLIHRVEKNHLISKLYFFVVLLMTLKVVESSESTINITLSATHHTLCNIDYRTKKNLPWHSNARVDNRSTNKNVILITFFIIHHLFSRKNFYHHLSTLSEELKLQWKGLWKTNEHWTKAQFRARSRVFFAGTISSSAAARMTRRMVPPRLRHYALSLRGSLGLLHSSDVRYKRERREKQLLSLLFKFSLSVFPCLLELTFFLYLLYL